MKFINPYNAIPFLLAVLLSHMLSAATQQPQLARPVPPRASAPIDLTGYWVSVITEDWRWRMLTPGKGDYNGVPLNAEGRRVADTWDLSRDKAEGTQCKAYSAPAIMRIPTRLHITWENDDTLRIESDAGQQTRLFHFDRKQAPPTEAGWQGYSVASWDLTNFLPTNPLGGITERGPVARGGNLKVVTSHLRPGYLRWNGVPYSDAVILTEYFDRHADYGTEWMTVTAIVDDPQYLSQRFIVSSHFKREPDASKWNPRPCEILPPAVSKR